MIAQLASWQHAWTQSPLWQSVGWTMVHFLWLGTVVALIGALLRIAFRRLSPTLRYAQSLAVFTTLVLLPVGIATWLHTTQQEQFRVSGLRPAAKRPVNSTPQALTPPTRAPDLAERSFDDTVQSEKPDHSTAIHSPANPLAERGAWKARVAIHNLAAYLPWLWLAGAPLTFALLATGLVGSERLRRCSLPPPEIVARTCRQLSKSLQITRQVGIALCDRIAQPVLVGIVRPLILLPPSALAGWSPEQLEMVLLHELAHVRRWDNLINFLQRLVESLLFFHPAVWLVSRWIRRDREESCDAVVVARTAAPQAYADLLVSIAASATPLAGVALARHPLTHRIRRILHLEDEPMLVSRSTLGMVVIALTTLLAFALWYPSTQTVAEETKNELAKQNDPTAEAAASVEEMDSPVQSKIYQYEVNTPQDVIEERITQLEAAGFTVHINKNDGGVVSVRGIKKVPPTASQAPPALPVFLPLEHQRAADFAYKMLGLELEQLGPEDLERAKAMKFAGGLLITNGEGGLGSGAISLQHNDILVGLHVWPISSLDDVAKILRRDDIVELSPLKFFVIRRVQDDPSNTSSTVDKLVTGRVTVNLEAVKNKPKGEVPAWTAAPSSQTQDRTQYYYQDLTAELPLQEQVSPALHKRELEFQIRDAKKQIELKELTLQEGLDANEVQPGAVAEADIRRRKIELERANLKLDWAEAQLADIADRTSVKKQGPTFEPEKIAPADGIFIRVDGALPDQPIDDVYHVESAGTVALGPTYGRIKVAGKTLAEAEDAATEHLKELLADPIVQITWANTKRNKTSLHYDGKTFDEWKKTWRQDLSINLRIEAVRAFVAFANAGNGKEAVDEIMAIIAEYDWTAIGVNNVVKPLQNACVAVFEEGQIPIEIAVETIIAAKDSKSSRVRAFLPYVLQRLSQANEKANESLRKAFPESNLTRRSRNQKGW